MIKYVLLLMTAALITSCARPMYGRKFYGRKNVQKNKNHTQIVKADSTKTESSEIFLSGKIEKEDSNILEVEKKNEQDQFYDSMVIKNAHFDRRNNESNDLSLALVDSKITGIFSNKSEAEKIYKSIRNALNEQEEKRSEKKTSIFSAAIFILSLILVFVIAFGIKSLSSEPINIVQLSLIIFVVIALFLAISGLISIIKSRKKPISNLSRFFFIFASIIGIIILIFGALFLALYAGAIKIF